MKEMAKSNIIMKRTKKEKKKYKKTWGTPVGKDCISLNSTLAGWLATRLKFLSKHANGYPAFTFDTYEDYLKALKKQAKRLQAYSDFYTKTFLGNEADELKIHVDAQKAIDWVA